MAIITTGCDEPPCKKILALHGGGQNAQNFHDGVTDIIEAGGARGYEFIFVNGAYKTDPSEDGFVWFRDPPGGKSSPTTDPDWDLASRELIDGIVASEGPFFGILGYSQGTPALLSTSERSER